MPDLPLPGQVLAGKYRIEGLLGRGGMGVVLSAHHLGLNRRVALKFLSNESPDELSLQRFLREARAVVQLESQHVARVLDASTLESGVPYIVMEHLRGSNLKQILRSGGPLQISQAVDYLMQACDALAEAHALGIVHRDLKPSNLFLSDRVDGVPRLLVLDFGISKARKVESFSGAETTSTEAILGSPQYMAPEQIRSAKDADARSDIWSLGTILYEFLTGAPAYSAETLPGLLASIVADAPPSLSRSRPEAPAPLDAVLRRCLEKQPERRFQSVAALCRALLPFASAGGLALAERASRILGEANLIEGDDAVPGRDADSLTLAPASLAAPQRNRRRVALALPFVVLAVITLMLYLRAPRAPQSQAQQPKATAEPPHSNASTSAPPPLDRSPTNVPEAVPSSASTGPPRRPSTPLLPTHPPVAKPPVGSPRPYAKGSNVAAIEAPASPPSEATSKPSEATSTPAQGLVLAPAPSEPVRPLATTAPKAAHPLDVFSDPQ